jgi:hypothetical protein
MLHRTQKKHGFQEMRRRNRRRECTMMQRRRRGEEKRMVGRMVISTDGETNRKGLNVI